MAPLSVTGDFMLSLSPQIEFVPGESQLGQYQLQIARLSSTGWSTTVPPLQAIVTNCRLILKPQTLKPYPPASIPQTYVISLRHRTFDRYPGVQVMLKGGYELNVVVGWSQTDLFVMHLRRMLIPASSIDWVPKLSENTLHRLIDFITGF